ncbi:hypothetical protein Ahy_B08g089600 [Arachis hypogaea]|uniref:Uncharacterized protein n=1 Tax=Arachis hypogaea TaxID=3818 RepID=A0A444XYA0_ARAHY|nr:hypothetical protein Ahy_B08g089600 [Arachis hypogaea]
MKVSWGLIEKKDALWSRVLQSKYGGGDDTIPQVERNQSNSNLWKGVCANSENVTKNTIWRVGNGESINFWKHNWVPNLGSLDMHVNQGIGTLTKSKNGSRMT